MSFGPTDLGSYVHLRNLLDAFQKRALNYCSSPETRKYASSGSTQMNGASQAMENCQPRSIWRVPIAITNIAKAALVFLIQPSQAFLLIMSNQ